MNYIGTERVCSPEETLKKIETKLNFFGITRVANITGLDCLGLPVYVCVRPNGKHMSTSQGKGLKDTYAKVSAIMESIELFHAENIREKPIRKSYNDIILDKKVFNISKLPKGRLWEKEMSSTMPIDWIKGTSLYSGEDVFLPLAYFNFDSSFTHSDVNIFATSTNGLASGNNKDEALIHAILELIERHNDYEWLRGGNNRNEKGKVVLDSIAQKDVSSLIISLLKQCDIHIWDISLIGNIPTFKCLICEKDKARGLRPFWGSGTHLNKDVAIIRAITEACQARLTYISGSRDDISRKYYESNESSEAEIFLAQEVENVDYEEIPSSSDCVAFNDYLEYLISILKDFGVEELSYYDHYSPTYDVNVVHVIASNLKSSASKEWIYE